MANTYTQIYIHRDQRTCWTIFTSSLARDRTSRFQIWLATSKLDRPALSMNAGGWRADSLGKRDLEASRPAWASCPPLYLIAPMVSPRTSCRETMMLKMITGRATSVPVAMI